MKVAFFDIDGTLVDGFVGVAFLGFLAEKGKFKKENKDSLFATVRQYREGNATYEQIGASWGESIAGGLQGQSVAEISELANEYWSHIETKLGFWVKDLISLFNAKGFTTIAISGSPVELLDVYKEKLGFSEIHGTITQVKNGIYTGNIVLNTVLSNEKEMEVNKVIEKDNISLPDSFGFGDNEHDRAFLDKVGHPIAISSESSLKHHAKSQGWPVFNFSDNVFEEVKSLLEKEN